MNVASLLGFLASQSACLSIACRSSPVSRRRSISSACARCFRRPETRPHMVDRTARLCRQRTCASRCVTQNYAMRRDACRHRVRGLRLRHMCHVFASNCHTRRTVRKRSIYGSSSGCGSNATQSAHGSKAISSNRLASRRVKFGPYSPFGTADSRSAHRRKRPSVICTGECNVLRRVLGLHLGKAVGQLLAEDHAVLATVVIRDRQMRQQVCDGLRVFWKRQWFDQCQALDGGSDGGD
jgi:hypothetical protein